MRGRFDRGLVAFRGVMTALLVFVLTAAGGSEPKFLARFCLFYSAVWLITELAIKASGRGN